MSSTPKPRGKVFILVTLVLDAMGVGLILPVMPDLIKELNGGTVGDAAIWGGILLTTFSVMQFLFGPLLGALSDRFGRRPVLLISLAVMTLDYVLMAVAHTIWLIFLTRVIGGITAATQSTASAFMADISDRRQKSANFGLVGAAFGLGFVLGPVIGGLLAQYGLRAPFWAAAGLSGVNFLYGLFILPETVTDRTRRAFDMKRANPLGAFKAVSHLPRVTRLLILLFVYEFSLMVYPAIWAYFPKERFGWDPAMVGFSLMLFGISMAIVQGGLMRYALTRVGERRLIIFGLAFEGLAFLILTMISSGFWALILIPISALGAVVTPALQGRMSRIAKDDQQGELQGVIASARAVAAIVSPLVMTQIFWFFTVGGGPYVPGAPFALSALLMGLCLIVFATRKRGR
ncbi:MAG: tetracycline resistance MFS efflux pump [Rhodobacterales bacterium]|nr:MAG: tetracycline resistance MFS efflux pump [Rhodobacterales bacterium]